MKKIFSKLMTVVSLSALALGSFAQNFTPGNLVVSRVGDGNTAVSGAAINLSLLEYTTAGAAVGSTFTFPLTTVGSVNRVLASATATNDCSLSLSTDGSQLLVGGYDAASGTAAVATTALANRVVAAIDNTKNVSTNVMTYATTYSANNFRSAVKDCNTLWFAGAGASPNGVCNISSVNSSTTTAVASTINSPTSGAGNERYNSRVIKIFEGNIYYSTGSGTTGIYQLGTGLPTGNTAISLIKASTGPAGFAFVKVGATYILYVANNATGKIEKYNGTSVATLGALNGSATLAGVLGLTAVVSGANVNLYATTATNLYSLTDANAASSALSGTPASIATAGANYSFRGVEFAPNKLAPTTQLSNIVFSAVGQDSMIVSVTAGNGAGRIIRMNTTNTFTNPTGTPTANGTYTSGEQTIYLGTSNTVTVKGLAASNTYYFRAYEYSVPTAGCNTKIYNLSSVTASQATLAPPPGISITSTMGAFSTPYGAASTSQSFLVSGSSLTANVILTAPTGYEISTGSTYSSAVTLTPVSGSLSSTTINVRLIGNSTTTTVSGNITAASTGATTQNVAVTGEVIPHLIINEVYAQPSVANPTAFIELYNTESFAVNLQNYTLGGVTYTFPSTSIAANGYLAVYATSYTGSLPATAGTVSIFTPAANTVNSISYTNVTPWPTIVSGFSLELNTPPSTSNTAGASWHISSALGGTPGAVNSAPLVVTKLYSRGSGLALTDAIWSNTPTGTGAPVAAFGGFKNTVDLEIQNGHTVLTQTNAITMKNLNVNSGATLDRAPRSTAGTTSGINFINVYGNIVNNGSIGTNTVLDSLGIDIEGANDTISGTGLFSIGRLAKFNIANPTTNLVLNQDINLWYGSNSLYNNLNATTFNIKLEAGKTIDFHSLGSFPIASGAQGLTATRPGVATINGNIINCVALYARSANTTGVSGLVLGPNASITADTVFVGVGSTNSYDFTITHPVGASIIVNKALKLVAGTYSPLGIVRMKSTAGGQCAYIDNFTTGYTGTLSGNVIAERFVPVNTATKAQHMMSSPINAPAFSALGVALTGTDLVGLTPSLNCSEDSLYYTSNYGNVFQWDETKLSSGSSTDCFQKAWVVRSAGNMSNTRGYSVYLTSNQAFSMTGQPNLSASYTASNLTNSNWTSTSAEGHPYNSGWHLIGNPYLATLAISGITSTVDNQIQIFQTSGAYKGTFATYLRSSAIKIAPFQAFYVHNSSTSTPATFTMAKTNLVAGDNNSNFYKTANDHSLTVIVAGNGFADKTEINFNSAATAAFDVDLDGAKFASTHGQPTIYTTTTDGQWYGINTLKTITESTAVPLSVSAGANGQFSLTFEGLESFDAATVILEDKKLNTKTPITATSIYTFTAKATDASDRFVLHFAAQQVSAGIATASASNIKAYTVANSLIVDFSKASSTSANIEVYNLLGQSILSDTYTGTGIYSREIAGINTGYAILKIKTESGDLLTQKVYLCTK